MGQTKPCHHPPTPTSNQNISTTTHHHSPPPTNSQNISSTIHYYPQPLTIIHHQPPTAKIQSPSPTTTHHQPKYINHHQQQSEIYLSKKVFHKKNIKTFYSKVEDEKHFDQLFIVVINFPRFKKSIYKKLQPLCDDNVRKLTSRPAIAKKIFLMNLSIIFITYTGETV